MKTVTPLRHASAGAPLRATPIEALTDSRRALLLVASLTAATLPLFVLGPAVQNAAALHPLAGPAAWFPAGGRRAVLLDAPLAVFGALALLWTPGLLAALALDCARNVEEWVLHGFALSLLVVSAAAAAVQAVAGAPLTGDRFAAVVGACSTVAAAAVLVRVRLGAAPRWPLRSPYAASTLAGMCAVPLLLLVGLAPKFYWEAFNGDGVHAYESARLLLYQAVPFFAPGSGEIAGFPDTKSFLFAYPASWFIRLFGPLEVSARLPMLLYLPPLAAALFALIATGTASVLRAPERWLVWLALTCYVVVSAFSATYSPYSADIALPATQDTLLVVAFLGFVHSLLNRRYLWALLWAFLTHVSLPNGLLLMTFWLTAWWLVHRRRPWHEIGLGAAVIAGAVVAAGLIGPLLAAAGAPAPGGEYGAAGLLLRFAFLQVTDWTRLAYVVVPCGILPALALLLWNRQDRISRAFTLVTAAYFLFAFVQAHAPLHYYIPAMLMPLIVYWRLDDHERGRRPVILGATATAGILALLLSWPAEPGPFTAARDVGTAVDVRISGYHRLEPEPLRASTLLRWMVPYDWDERVPHSSLGGSPIVFQYYAHAGADSAPRNYVLQRTQDPAPPGADLIAAESDHALYVLDHAVWEAHLALRPATPPGAAPFQQARSTLFRSVPVTGGPRVIDLPALAARMGIDIEALARRFGVEP